MRRCIAVAVSLAIAGMSLGSYAAAAPLPTTTTELPRIVVPQHYAISFTPNIEAKTFHGSVVIDVEVLKPTRTIVLNAANLKVTEAVWYVVNPLARVIPRHPAIRTDEKSQTLTLTLENPAEPGKYQLQLEYSGEINSQANGLFALDYDTPQGKKRGIYTQFENSDARRFVPSWDEPSYKATFDLTVTAPDGLMAVSNMPVESSGKLDGNLRATTFARSPKMSTYLLFFGLGDFERATAMAGPTEVGVITQRGKVDQAKGALEGSVKVLQMYNDYFGVPYPLPKLDNIAAPGRSQFFSAMENWGAIFTFEHTLLEDPVVSTNQTKRGIFGTASHEIAHQWFGNLVTMDWWDDLWLNEGFATWMAGWTTERVHPEWESHLNRVWRREGAMAQDALKTTHPVVQKIRNVDQASQAFDGITYSKGGSVIKMLETYVGEDNWRNGVRKYIKKHAYGNATSDDLWAAIQAEAGKSVLDIAHDFTLKPGVPLVSLQSATCKAGKTHIQLQAGEYTTDRPGKKPLRWRIPVSAQVLGHPVQWSVLSKANGSMTLPGCGTVILDPQQTGYYRISYTAPAAKLLADDFAKLAPIDQIGLLSNQRAMVTHRSKPYSQFGDLLLSLPPDANANVWDAATGAFSEMYSLFEGDTATQSRVAKLTSKQLSAKLKALGWDAVAGESMAVGSLRDSLIQTLALIGDVDVLAEARRRYALDISGKTPLSGDARQTVWGIVARNADAATWEQILDMARKETTPLIKQSLYSDLASAKDETLARRTLELALTPEVGATGGAALIQRIAYEHPEMALDFALAHLDQVHSMVDISSRYRYFPRLIAGSNKAASIAKLRAYGAKNIPADARRSMEESVAAIEQRIAQQARMRPRIKAWLTAKGY